MVNASIERELIQKFREMDEARQQLVLQFVTHAAQEQPAYSASELLLLPPQARDPLIAAAFDAAANEDFELFEADEFLEDGEAGAA